MSKCSFVKTGFKKCVPSLFCETKNAFTEKAVAACLSLFISISNASFNHGLKRKSEENTNLIFRNKQEDPRLIFLKIGEMRQQKERTCG